MNSALAHPAGVPKVISGRQDLGAGLVVTDYLQIRTDLDRQNCLAQNLDHSALEIKHLGNARTVDINIKKSDAFIRQGQGNGKLGCYRALSHAALTRENQNFVLDLGSVFINLLSLGLHLLFLI